MREVGGAVERIDVPAILASGIVQAFFLAQHIVRWPERTNALANQRFGFAVGGCDEVGVALVFNFDVQIEVLHEERARLAGDCSYGGNEFVIGWQLNFRRAQMRKV